MKSFISFVIVSVLLLAAYPADSQVTKSLVELRKELYAAHKDLQLMLKTTDDTAIVYTLWTTSAQTIIRLDAYFMMVGITDSYRDKGFTKDAADYMLVWLKEIRRDNDSNLKGIKAPEDSARATKEITGRLNQILMKLKVYLDTEIKVLQKLKDALSG
jgi:hypothetical protein